MGYTLSFDKTELFTDEAITIDVVDDGAGLPGNVTFGDQVSLGSFSPNPVAVGSSTTWTPGAAGNTNLSSTNDAGFSDPSPTPVAVCTHATGYDVSFVGPHRLGHSDAVNVNANGGTNAAFDGGTTVTIVDSLGGDSPGSIMPGRYQNGSVNHTFTQYGSHTFTATNDHGLGDPVPVAVTVPAPTWTAASNVRSGVDRGDGVLGTMPAGGGVSRGRLANA